jgi:hypothetical protein
MARDAMKKYIHFVATEEWPAMAQGEASLRQLPPDLSDAMTNLLAVRAIEQAPESRQNRVLLSEAGIAPIQWIVIVVLVALILLTIAMVHIDRPATVAVNILALSTAVAVRRDAAAAKPAACAYGWRPVPNPSPVTILSCAFAPPFTCH